MFCSDTARRKSNVSDKELSEKFDSITASYCSECASRHKLPILTRVIVNQIEKECDICGDKKVMYGELMRDNEKIKNLLPQTLEAKDKNYTLTPGCVDHKSEQSFRDRRDLARIREDEYYHRRLGRI